WSPSFWSSSRVTRASQIGDSSRLDSPGKPRSHRDEPRGEGRAASEQQRRADSPGIGRDDLERPGRYPQRREDLAEGASPHRQAEDRGADGQKQFRSVKAARVEGDYQLGSGRARYPQAIDRIDEPPLGHQRGCEDRAREGHAPAAPPHLARALASE